MYKIIKILGCFVIAIFLLIAAFYALLEYYACCLMPENVLINNIRELGPVKNNDGNFLKDVAPLKPEEWDEVCREGSDKYGRFDVLWEIIFKKDQQEVERITYFIDTHYYFPVEDYDGMQDIRICLKRDEAKIKKKDKFLLLYKD